MPIFLDTRGHSTLAIAVCARCGIKYPRDELVPDPNFPGLLVCSYDRDDLDPWRLPPKPADRITVDQPRPDLPLYPLGPVKIYANEIDGISQVFPVVPWTPTTFYQKGASVTPLNTSLETTPVPQYQFVALPPGGISGQKPPAWPTHAGIEIQDGAVTWLCVGIYLLE